MNILVNDMECKLTIESLALKIGTYVDNIDDFIKHNKLKKSLGGGSSAFVDFPNEVVSIFNSKFNVRISISKKYIDYIWLTLAENAPTSQKRDGVAGIYFDNLCELEVSQLIKLVSTSLGRLPDKTDSQGGNRAKFKTKWGRININYSIRGPIVGIFLSDKP